MDTEKRIVLQIDSNSYVNLLSTQQNGFHFTDTTRKLIKEIAHQRFTTAEENELLHFTVNAALSSFYRVNQYYYFDEQAKSDLLFIYKQLLHDIKNSAAEKPDYDHLAITHYLRLQQWLIKKQPDAVLLYPASRPAIAYPVVCAEYSVQTQLQTLGLEEAHIKDPILDIGCGKEHHLVNYLGAKGYDIHGIDRDVTPGSNVFKIDWLGYSYKQDHWGAIVSHLGFTNHFRHQHLKANGQHLEYAATYIRILQSLKIGGSFSIPLIFHL